MVVISGPGKALVLTVLENQLAADNFERGRLIAAADFSRL